MIKVKIFGESKYLIVGLLLLISFVLIVISLLSDKQCKDSVDPNPFNDIKMVIAYVIGSVGVLLTIYLTFENNNRKNSKIKNNLK